MQPAEPSQFKRTILVVDDELVVLRLASTVLSDAGFQAVVAENAAAGFEKYRQLRPDVSLVLVDIVMPGGTGLELADRILALDSSVKILVMSGYSDSEIEHRARARFPFIRKPFLRDDLLHRVSEVLGGKHAERG